MGNLNYKSSYKGREIDEAIKQVKENIPTQIERMKEEIKSLGDTKADTKIVPKKVSQLENDVEFVSVDDDYYAKTEDVGNLLKLKTTAKDSLVNAINEIFNTGGVQGANGVGIESIEQTITSIEDKGINVVTVTLTNGEIYNFQVLNGSKGNKGDPYILTEEDKQEIIESMADEGYVKNTDYATKDKAGVVKIFGDAVGSGIYVDKDGYLMLFAADRSDIETGAGNMVITTHNIDFAVNVIGNRYFATKEQVNKLEQGYELIQKIIVGYSVLTSIPSDWDMNYSSYYKNTGTLREPIYTALTELEEWETGKYYSYDETLGKVVDFEYEPDGKQFLFSKVYLYWKDTSAFGANINGALTIQTTETFPTFTRGEKVGVVGNVMYVTKMASTSTEEHVVIAEINNGLLQAKNYLGQYGKISDYSIYTHLKPGEKITGLRLRGTSTARIAGNTEIYVYGVRA